MVAISQTESRCESDPLGCIVVVVVVVVVFIFYFLKIVGTRMYCCCKVQSANGVLVLLENLRYIGLIQIVVLVLLSIFFTI